MAKPSGTVEVRIERCKGCGLCIASCPSKALVFSKGINTKGFNYAVLEQEKCVGCGICAMMCPDAVLTVYKEKKQA